MSNNDDGDAPKKRVYNDSTYLRAMVDDATRRRAKEKKESDPRKETATGDSKTPPVRLVARRADPDAIRRALSAQPSRAEEAIRRWKSDPAIRARFPNFIDYYDHLGGDAANGASRPEEHANPERGSDAERGEAAIAAGKAKVCGGRVVTIPRPGGKGAA